MKFEFADTEATDAFFHRHPGFCDCFELVMETGNKVFGRESRPENLLQDVGFGLGHTCREDYVEIVFMATGGYGEGAFKLFRSLYERAVALAYLVQNPDKVERFVNYAAIQEHRTMQAAFSSGVNEEQFDKAMAPVTVAGIRELYKKHKGAFQVKCGKCGAPRVAPSWDLDVAAMVNKVGSPFTNIFLVGYAIPNLRIHATLSAAMKDFDKERARDLDERAKRKREDGDFVLSLATAVFVEVMRAQNTAFKLSIEADLDACDRSVMEVWGTYYEIKHARQT